MSLTVNEIKNSNNMIHELANAIGVDIILLQLHSYSIQGN